MPWSVGFTPAVNGGTLSLIQVVKRLRRNGGAVGWEFVDIVVSVIELGDRPDDEQRHVRQQAREG